MQTGVGRGFHDFGHERLTTTKPSPDGGGGDRPSESHHPERRSCPGTVTPPKSGSGAGEAGAQPYTGGTIVNQGALRLDTSGGGTGCLRGSVTVNPGRNTVPKNDGPDLWSYTHFHDSRERQHNQPGTVDELAAGNNGYYTTFKSDLAACEFPSQKTTAAKFQTETEQRHPAAGPVELSSDHRGGADFVAGGWRAQIASTGAVRRMQGLTSC